MRRALCVAAAVVSLGAAACVPPSPPPAPISGVSSEVGTIDLTYTAVTQGGIVAYHCFADVPYTVALTDANGVEYGAVTQAVATSHMDLLGANCNPFFWTVHVSMTCTPDCGGPQGLWTGATLLRVTMPFLREPNLAKIVLHVEATYAGTPAVGAHDYTLGTILCGANPTNGVRTCLFQ